MVQQYETVFILNPVLSEEQTRETVEKFKGIIEAKGGEVTHVEHWGLRKLAYPIQKKRSGFYHLLEFKAPGELIDTLETELKRDERVMRYLTVRMDKDHIEYAKKRRQKLQNA
ncbi:30S ribosomal protein S6 [Thermaurantimonas aggregans]|uniref:Small ribosomal subunit protein bS6 n=1 Tax=Thermaurantimonas aggregans TaxID=2173829 RepID=A0A401XM90_9FLAO|nr:30S ribosomal protein S6 [Thermaurantimonas aggregans]MCX8147987.1 30S ribosomal protein S6 [Thermaurantimonas aggregans]GCD78116.1 30S ribosomal protein S6 [Thermaurantimonas aggregans]